jgi:transposase InsO family protein
MHRGLLCWDFQTFAARSLISGFAMRAELCCDALNMALGRRGLVPGLINHSDRGSQYAGGDYRKLI